MIESKHRRKSTPDVEESTDWAVEPWWIECDPPEPPDLGLDPGADVWLTGTPLDAAAFEAWFEEAEIDAAIRDGGAVFLGELDRWRTRLGETEMPSEQARLVDLLRGLEELKSCAAAIQARVVVSLEGARKQAEADQGVRRSRRGVGLGTEVGLARRESPFRGSILLGVAKALVTEMPRTLAALQAGTLNEWRATLIARETQCLDREGRAEVDAWFERFQAEHPSMSTKRMVAEVRRKVTAVDPGAVVRRNAAAAGGRRVGLQPLPDGMVRLTAILGLQEGVATYAALLNAAKSAQANGGPGWERAVKGGFAVPDESGQAAEPDPSAPLAAPDGSKRRKGPGRGALMADELVRRVTGAPASAPCGIELMVVITDRALFGVDEEPAHVDGYGAMPASWVRDLITQADPEQQVAVRRLFRAPGRMVKMEVNRRSMSPGLRKLIRLRDQRCRMPWCDAPIRHDDHVRTHATGGESSYVNGQGLCEACNYTKSTAGWSATAVQDPDRGHLVTVTTPTGHAYQSTQPSGPGDEWDGRGE